jgi:hypothetical protein
MRFWPGRGIPAASALASLRNKCFTNNLADPAAFFRMRPLSTSLLR